MRRSLVLIGLPLAAALVGPVGLAAQEATPAASPVAIACPAEPRSADELLALWYDPAGSPVPGPVDASPTPLPAGEPADAGTVAAIDAAVQDWAACYNAGDILGTLALLSDDHVRRQGPQASASREQTEAALAAPPIPPTEPIVVGAAEEARLLADGRVCARFALGDPAMPGGALVIVFVEVDGRWLLDDIGTGAGDPAVEASPVP